MLSKIKNIFISKEQKLLNNSKAEYDKLIMLEQKRQGIVKEYGDDIPDEYKEYVQTQKEMIQNNFLMLAKTVDIEGGFKNSEEMMKKGIYFNMQGTKPSIILTTEEYGSKDFTDAGNGSNITSSRLDEGITYAFKTEIMELSKKFLAIKPGKLKSDVRNALHSKAEKLIAKKTIDFCKVFGDNAPVIQEYIFSGLQGENDHYHNIYEFEERLNIIGGLYYILKDMSFDIGPKEVVFIYCPKSIDLVHNLLSKINNRKYDFILGKGDGYGG